MTNYLSTKGFSSCGVILKGLTFLALMPILFNIYLLTVLVYQFSMLQNKLPQTQWLKHARLLFRSFCGPGSRQGLFTLSRFSRLKFRCGWGFWSDLRLDWAKIYIHALSDCWENPSSPFLADCWLEDAVQLLEVAHYMALSKCSSLLQSQQEPFSPLCEDEEV